MFGTWESMQRHVWERLFYRVFSNNGRLRLLDAFLRCIRKALLKSTRGYALTRSLSVPLSVTCPCSSATRSRATFPELQLTTSTTSLTAPGQLPLSIRVTFAVSGDLQVFHEALRKV